MKSLFVALAFICLALCLYHVHAQSAGSCSYTIASGDTLSKIAAKYQTTVSNLQSLNPSITNPDMIISGQTLNVPCSQAGQSSAQSGQSSSEGQTQQSGGQRSSGSSCSYTIASGDTLSKIAAKYQTTVSNLQSLNPSITNPDMIISGQTIKVPCA